MLPPSLCLASPELDCAAYLITPLLAHSLLPVFRGRGWVLVCCRGEPHWFGSSAGAAGPFLEVGQWASLPSAAQSRLYSSVVCRSSCLSSFGPRRWMAPSAFGPRSSCLVLAQVHIADPWLCFNTSPLIHFFSCWIICWPRKGLVFSWGFINCVYLSSVLFVGFGGWYKYI